MKTSKPLKELVPDMINHVKAHYESHVMYNSALIDISNGNLLKYVEESMKKELNPRSFEISKNRIPPINVLSKLQTKLSKVYGETPVRTAGDNGIDAELLEGYEDAWDLNANLQYANDLLVINKYVALEPTMVDQEAQMRVLSAKDFIVYSDSKVNPTEMTVFIKFMGTTSKLSGGTKARPKFKQVPLFYAYSDDEFLIFDAESVIYNESDNPHGKIPFVYLRANNNELIPTPDSDNLPMTVLIPKLMADLNYAVMFGCRSQVVGIDVEMDNVEWSPDSMWILSSVEGENKNPSLDTIKSDVDVDKVLNLINTQLGLWLDTKGIKTSSVGKATVENAASGIAKLIDESDATAVNRKYKKIFQNAEKRLWKLTPTLHQTWIDSKESDATTTFSKDFKPSVELVEAKIVPNKKEMLEEMKLEDELGIFNKETGIKKLNPDASKDELAKLLEDAKGSLNIVISPPTKEEEE